MGAPGRRCGPTWSWSRPAWTSTRRRWPRGAYRPCSSGRRWSWAAASRAPPAARPPSGAGTPPAGRGGGPARGPAGAAPPPARPSPAAVPVTAGDASSLTATWARAHLRDLEDRYATDPVPDRELERRIARTSPPSHVAVLFTA